MASHWHLMLLRLCALQLAVASSDAQKSASDVDSGFLRRKELPSEAAEKMISAVEVALGSSHRQLLEARLPSVEAHIKKLLPAVPTNLYGNLGPAAVRYIMHRLFVQRHGWHVKGFDPIGGAWNASSPIKALGDLLPAHVPSLFEELLSERGFGLPELSVLAATLETLVRHEAQELLRGSYDALRVPRNVSAWVTVDQADELIDAHMSSFILGETLSAKNSPSTVRKRIRKMSKVYPGWRHTRAWLRDLRQQVVTNTTERFYFDNVSAVIDYVGERYGRWQDRECTELKNDLTALEDIHTPGCVRLIDFHTSGMWQFTESREYLQTLGALEESDPAEPYVLTANYIQSSSNCVANSFFYRVCCRDTCGELHDHIVSVVGAPDASPVEIVDALKDAPPSDLLQQRLRDVALRNGGRVPLHGRLFAQWLHQVRPRDCPFPHLAGATHPQWLDQFQATGRPSTISKIEVQELLRNKASRLRNHSHKTPGNTSCVPWMPQEELLLVEDPAATISSAFFVELAFSTSASLSLLFGLFRMFKKVRYVATGGCKNPEAVEVVAI